MSSKSPREELQPYIDFAFVEFGMSEDEFMAQTPQRWSRIIEVWFNKERRADRRTARICSALTGVSEDEFMPRLSSQNEDEQSIDEMFVVIQSVAPKQNGQ